MTARERRWRGAVAATFALVAAGAAAGSDVLLVAATVPLVFVALSSIATVPAAATVEVTRTLDSRRAPPDGVVGVELVVENTSPRAVADVRVVDGVPADLAVVGGTPRGGGSLEPGETMAVTYEVLARRGTHEFDEPTVRLRGVAGDARVTQQIAAGGDAAIECRIDILDQPVDPAGRLAAGRLETGEPGEGLTFHSTREYRHGDPADRLDWRHFAKTRELATVSYDRPVKTAVILLVDARSATRVVPGPGRSSALELGVYAAARACSALLERGHDVGVAILGVQRVDGPDLHFVPPGTGPAQRAAVVDALTWAVDGATVAANPWRQLTWVIEQTPVDGQLAIFSPLLDEWPVSMIERCLAANRPVTLLSPDVLADNTVSGGLEVVGRRTRLATCQAAGARTIDWRRGTPLALVLERAFEAERVGGGR